MSNIISFDLEARNKLKAGIDKLANAVKVTLGPKGRNVVISNNTTRHHVTKDGVTVAKEVNLDDPIENLGANMIKQAASKIADNVGDGTTTVTVLVQSMVDLGMKYINAGANPMEIKTGMDITIPIILDYLDNNIISVEDDSNFIYHIANISANNDEKIAELISNTYKKIGIQGTITLETSKNNITTVEEVIGLRFDRGYISKYFINDINSDIIESKNISILLYNDIIEDIQSIYPVLESSLSSEKPVLIICKDINEKVISNLIINKIRGKLDIIVVKASSNIETREALFEDLSIITNSKIVTNSTGNILECLGESEKVLIGEDFTTIINNTDNNLNIKSHINNLKKQTTSEDPYKISKIKSRISKLQGGVAVIYVGGNSDIEIGEKKDRIEDALFATKAAIEYGVVLGGGLSLVNASQQIHTDEKFKGDINLGIQIVKNALYIPLKSIASNSGVNGEIVLEKVLLESSGIGYNAKNNTYVDLKSAGILDPVQVTKSVVESAISIASMILTTECVIINNDN